MATLKKDRAPQAGVEYSQTTPRRLRKKEELVVKPCSAPPRGDRHRCGGLVCWSRREAAQLKMMGVMGAAKCRVDEERLCSGVWVECGRCG